MKHVYYQIFKDDKPINIKFGDFGSAEKFCKYHNEKGNNKAK